MTIEVIFDENDPVQMAGMLQLYEINSVQNGEDPVLASIDVVALVNHARAMHGNPAIEYDVMENGLVKILKDNFSHSNPNYYNTPLPAFLTLYEKGKLKVSQNANDGAQPYRQSGTPLSHASGISQPSAMSPADIMSRLPHSHAASQRMQQHAHAKEDSEFQEPQKNYLIHNLIYIGVWVAGAALFYYVGTNLMFWITDINPDTFQPNPSDTPEPTVTHTPTLTHTPTNTPTQTSTPSPTFTPTEIPIPTNTPRPGDNVIAPIDICVRNLDEIPKFLGIFGGGYFGISLDMYVSDAFQKVIDGAGYPNYVFNRLSNVEDAMLAHPEQYPDPRTTTLSQLQAYPDLMKKLCTFNARDVTSLSPAVSYVGTHAMALGYSFLMFTPVGILIYAANQAKQFLPTINIGYDGVKEKGKKIMQNVLKSFR